MKKLLLAFMTVVTVSLYLSPSTRAQQFCSAGFQYVIGTPTPNGASVSFYDSSFTAGTITAWSWSFGNGTGSTLQNPVGFLNPGNNYVCLTITAIYLNQTCTSTYCDSIFISVTPPPCNASFSYNVSPQGVQFNAAAGSNVSWTWDFGDGSTGTGANVFHPYAAGTYTVCLTVLDASGVTCDSCMTIVVPSGGGCQAYFVASSIPGSTVYVFADQSLGTPATYLWNFGDGNTSTLQNPTHTYNLTGWFNVCLTISTSSGCTDTYCDSVLVGGGVFCDPAFTYQSSPASSVFIATGATNVSWTWDFGDGSSGTGGPTITHAYTTAGTYNVCLTVTTANGQACTSCQNIVVQNGSSCSSNFAIYPDTLTPHTYYAINLASGAAPLTYLWSWGDGTSSNTAYPSHTYASGGLYTICLSITDATGCTSTTCYQWQLLRLSGSGVPVTINVVPGTVGLVEQDPSGSLSVFPNPATDLIGANFTIAKESSVTFQLVNLAGQTVLSIPSIVYNAGTHDIKLDATGLSKGMYVLEIQSEGFRTHQKVIVQ